MIYALLSSGDEAMKTLALKVRRGEASEVEIANLVRFTHEMGGIDYTKKILDKTGRVALSLLNSEGKEKCILDSLSEYVHFVVGRDL